MKTFRGIQNGILLRKTQAMNYVELLILNYTLLPLGFAIYLGSKDGGYVGGFVGFVLGSLTGMLNALWVRKCAKFFARRSALREEKETTTIARPDILWKLFFLVSFLWMFAGTLLPVVTTELSIQMWSKGVSHR